MVDLEFGSLREAFKINIRPVSSSAKTISDFDPLDGQESAQCIKERRKLYTSAWMDMGNIIEVKYC